MKYKRDERSQEERPRAMDEFYNDMLKPIRNLHEKRETRKKANLEKSQEFKLKYTKDKE